MTTKTLDGPDPIDVAVGARIRIQRAYSRMSQTDLANALGITFQQVQKYERGANRISASKLVAAAKALGTTVANLVGETGTQAPPDQLPALATPGAHKLLENFAAADGECRGILGRLADVLARTPVVHP